MNKAFQMRDYYKFIAILIATLSVISCTRYKDIVYLQEQEENNIDSLGYFPKEAPIYRIQKSDILYVKITTLNKEVMEAINSTPTTATNVFNSESSFYLYGYNVDEEGEIEIPIIGKVNVLDKTIEEARQEVKKSALVYIKDPTVVVKLISYKYSVFGEVLRPGTYTNFNNRLTVLEAISNAGNASPYGDIKKVTVIRTNEKGSKTYRLDLTDKNILASEGYFLLPNDIVYVEPVKSRNFRNNIPTYSLILGAISTLILIASFVSN
jgi:polysaccharide export outer membrane protein